MQVYSNLALQSGLRKPEKRTLLQREIPKICQRHIGTYAQTTSTAASTRATMIKMSKRTFDVARSRLRKRLIRGIHGKHSHARQTAVRNPLVLQQRRENTTPTVTHTRQKDVIKVVIQVWFFRHREHGRTISLLSTEGFQKTLDAQFQAANQRRRLVRR